VVELAQQRRLNPRALSGFALRPCDEDNGLVIGYGNTPAEQIAAGVAGLAQCVSEVAGVARSGRRGAGVRA
jgi:GntR family transcriptional regulator/MocR family aminotransferase